MVRLHAAIVSFASGKKNLQINLSNGLAYIITGEVENSLSPNDEDIDDENYWLGLGMVDVEAETESMRHEAEVRLRAQSNELKRFHDKVCLRVTERERQNRLNAQRAQKCLDAKCAKVFSTTELVQHTGNSGTARISSRPYFQKMKEDKKAILKDCPLGKHIEKMLRLDSQIRDDLLQSTETSSSQELSNSRNENGDNEDVSETTASSALLPEQRVALYATVRRQYMEMNRAKVKNNVWRDNSHSPSPSTKSPVSKTSTVGRVSRDHRDSTDHNEHTERWATTLTGVKVIDMTSGCDARVHRQTTTSSTPWRKKSAKGSKTQATTKERERFLRALQAQLGTPALCSCAKAGSSTQPCANNCALYKQPKKREKLLTSVYKQQQLDVTTAASPTR
ncbi:hypothetical protein F441_19070 [Phytophthora nicotianae CJ01A1]|uniref:Uncharacterized protein n=5 Tax=Phytophthora nicotianae TaxID=4792 RepID=V9E7A5_PHYNI|nr:hypothetical protein F443_19255 [Phytophthora nicotianae P1569]ETL27968.1 hypothetical protein L916_18586 [Phytophthora nicotianae]ETO63061.1 hypothetical protein F444_19208 [Phytophthora nicotianae P1976]ETP04084.1 hypothetical protein F441_19070 [Phytophthora nicotianae CJ01A1]ETL81215.1 hypothetical protein L917_18409 [Phytophthora nicotianae]